MCCDCLRSFEKPAIFFIEHWCFSRCCNWNYAVAGYQSWLGAYSFWLSQKRLVAESLYSHRFHRFKRWPFRAWLSSLPWRVQSVRECHHFNRLHPWDLWWQQKFPCVGLRRHPEIYGREESESLLPTKWWSGEPWGQGCRSCTRCLSQKSVGHLIEWADILFWDIERDGQDCTFAWAEIDLSHLANTYRWWNSWYEINDWLNSGACIYTTDEYHYNRSRKWQIQDDADTWFWQITSHRLNWIISIPRYCLICSVQEIFIDGEWCLGRESAPRSTRIIPIVHENERYKT